MKNVGGPKLGWPIPYRFRISAVFLPNWVLSSFFLNEKKKKLVSPLDFHKTVKVGAQVTSVVRMCEEKGS